MAQTTARVPALTDLELSGFRKSMSTRRRIFRAFIKNWSGMIGLFFLLLILGSAVFADQIACREGCLLPSDTQQNIAQRLRPPFWMEGANPRHVLGTDNLGRDVLARLIHGARASISVAILAGIMALVLGTAIGLVSGYFGGRTDSVIQRIADAQQAFPFLVIAIAIRAILGPNNVRIFNWPLDLNLIILIGYWGWVRYGKVTRGNVLSAKNKEYVEAAHVIGTPTVSILTRHLLPNVISPLIVLLTLSMAGLIVVESSLSFLGLGIQPPTPSWGGMLSDGRAYLENGWWVSTFAGLGIALTVLSINLLGDAVRDILDPRLRV